jgi:hypothetical protein
MNDSGVIRSSRRKIGGKFHARKWLSIVSFLGALGGLYATVVSGYNILRSTDARRWIEVDAVISDVSITVIDIGTSKSSVFREMASMRYKYSYHGVQYESDRMSFDRPWARVNYFSPQLARRYKAGDVLQVRVNPSNPQEAVASIDRTVAVVIFIVGIGLIVLWIWQVKHVRGFRLARMTAWMT